MGPNDWAWRFLRLKRGYRQAYQNARLAQAENLKSRTGAWPDKGSYEHRTIYVNENDCRRLFGLSTWLDPDLHGLPKLEDGQSWFAPLQSVAVHPESISGVVYSDGVFGYRPWDKPRVSPIRLEEPRSPGVWFAIDCSVPPDAQFLSVEFIVNQYGTRLRQEDLNPRDFFLIKEAVVLPLVGDRLFKEEDFQHTWGATDQLTKKADAWRLIRVDTIHTPDKNIKECHRQLKDEHAKLIKSGKAMPNHQRFRIQLDGDETGVGMDGNALKAYVILAECHLAGITDSKEIVRLLANQGAGSKIPEEPASKGRKREWIDDIEERAVLFDAHVERAKSFVRDGYKWLIYAQKPSSLES